MATLPDKLREKIDTLLHGISTEELAQHYKSMSDRYRRLSTTGGFQIANRHEALAYMTARMPATYGALAHVLAQIGQSLPDFTPETILDIGAGPGTATQACFAAWPDIRQATLIEPNAHLRDLSKALLTEAPCTFHAHSLSIASLDIPHDLVLLSYVLNELPEAEMLKNLERLWAVTAKTLVIIEPGTPLGYELIIKIRDRLIAAGASIAAPCPHQGTCPLVGTDKWCHFSTRIDRSSAHRRMKNSDGLSYEDEKFSYLVATRLPPRLPAARILGHPHGNKLVTLELCKADGTHTNRVFSKRDGFYKQAGKVKWGDSVPQTENI
jgi:ribosomal protein RSM22 (predicted rRNA methylase)